MDSEKYDLIAIEEGTLNVLDLLSLNFLKFS